jgi:hypothetical protein
MTRQTRILGILRFAWAVWMACVLSLPAQADTSGRTITALIQIPQDLKLKDEIYEDLNGDGREDLVLSTGHKTTRYARSLRIHYQRDSGRGFDMEPDQTIPLTPDVIAYACADVDPNPGREILLFTAGACFGYRLGVEPKDALFKIADCDFLWQIPDREHVFSWQRAVLDFDGDGKADVCVPQANGFTLLLQRDTGFVASNTLEIPCEPSIRHGQVRRDKGQGSVSLNLDLGRLGHVFGSAAGPERLLQVSDAVPVPVFTDFNGDRRIDVMTQTTRSLVVWQQGTAEPFATRPTRTFKLPKDDNDLTSLDLAANQYVLDLNQDRRCDFLLFARDKTSKKVFTQILVYLNHKDADQRDSLFDRQGMPDQLIKIAGLPGDAQLVDINVDGYPDLSFITFRPDLLDQVKTLASKSLELQFLAFFNDRGHFARRPDITQTIQVFVQEQNNSEQGQQRFFYDYNRDGLLDVLVRDTNGHLGLRLLQKTKDGIQIAKSMVWDMTIPDKAQLITERTSDPKRPVVLLMGPDQILIVRFQ